MNIRDFASKYLGKIKTVRNEISAEFCPFCSGGNHKDKWTFSINIDKDKQVYLSGIPKTNELEQLSNNLNKAGINLIFK